MKTGDKFEETFVVTEKIYNGFIAIFNDRNPLHVDNSYSQEKGFATCVMHGNILGGFLSYFIGECLPFKNVIIHSQELKFKLPIYLNDLLSFNAEIKDFFPSVNVYDFAFNFTNSTTGRKVASGKIQIGII